MSDYAPTHKSTIQANSALDHEVSNTGDTPRNKTKPLGVLSLCLKGVKILEMDTEKLFGRPHASVYMRATLLDQVKLTVCYEHLIMPCCIKFDEMKHFRVGDSDQTDQGTLEFLVFDLVAISPVNPNMHRIICSKSVNMFAVVNSAMGNKTLRLEGKGDTRHVEVELDIEFCFSYGLFGYGCSDQYEMSKNCVEHAKQSIFFRSEPPLSRYDVVNDVIHCQHVGPPNFVKFPFSANFNSPDTGCVLDDSPQGYQGLPLLKTKLDHFNENLERYNSLLSRKERIDFLKSMITNSNCTNEAGNLDYGYYFYKSGDTLKKRSLAQEFSDQLNLKQDNSQNQGVNDKTAIKSRFSLPSQMFGQDGFESHPENRSPLTAHGSGRRKPSLFSGRVSPSFEKHLTHEVSEERIDAKKPVLQTVEEDEISKQSEESQDSNHEKHNLMEKQQNAFKIPQMKIDDFDEHEDCQELPEIMRPPFRKRADSRRMSVTVENIPLSYRRGSVLEEAAKKVKQLFGTSEDPSLNKRAVVVVDADMDSEDSD